MGTFDATRVSSAHGHDHRDVHACHDPNCGHNSNHSPTFSTWSFEADRPLSLEALREVGRRLPTSIYRCRGGVIYTADVPGCRAALQVVGKRVNLVPEGKWGPKQPRTQIVVIGAPGSVNVESLQKEFASCIANCRP